MLQPAPKVCMQHSAYVALGGNMDTSLGSPEVLVTKAIVAIAAAIGTVTSQSAIYRTPSFPAGSGPDYANAVIRVETTLAPAEVLAALHRIEASFGRERQRRWGSRTLDLDLLAYDALIAPDRETYEHWRDLPLERQMRDSPDTLVLPHPRLHERGFVLVPLAEIAPGWRHPVLGLTAQEMRDARPVSELAEITAWQRP